MSHYHNYIVAAMDMLIGDPDVLAPNADTKKKADYLCIPIQYLDKLGEWRHELSSRGEASKRLIKSMGYMLSYINNHPDSSQEKRSGRVFTAENGMKIMFDEVPHSTEAHSTELAISLAKSLKFSHQQKKDGGVAIMTGSDWMVAKASAAHLDVARINPEIYTGRSKVKLPLDAAPLWTKNRHISQDEWNDIFPSRQIHFNEFVEFEIDNFGQIQNGYSNIGRFTYDEHGNPAVVPLKYAKFSSPSYRKIRPITNVQAMYLEALLAPVDEIPIVVFSGLFGTGKTFLAVAAGLNGVGYHTSVPNVPYDRIFICPRDSALGKDIGFLPGDVMNKTMPRALPVVDNIHDVLRIIQETATIAEKPAPEELPESTPPSDEQSGKTSRKRIRKHTKTTKDELAMMRSTPAGNIKKEVMDLIDKYVEFQPLINMGGRSISNSLIYYDEFQDVERFQARELISRIGNGSKVVITGDPTQLSNPHLNRTSNGLNYIATKLADKPYAAIITCDTEEEIVRHWVLREIAKDLR